MFIVNKMLILFVFADTNTKKNGYSDRIVVLF